MPNPPLPPFVKGGDIVPVGCDGLFPQVEGVSGHIFRPANNSLQPLDRPPLERDNFASFQ